MKMLKVQQLCKTYALLMQASHRYQQTILMITHNSNLTASVDRVFRVRDGVLKELGGVQQ